MEKCLRITFSKNKMPNDFLRTIVQKYAKKLDIEGVAQVLVSDQRVRIIACGRKDDVDEFLDQLHKHFTMHLIQEVEIEPFIRDRDYRKVFRIIE